MENYTFRSCFLNIVHEDLVGTYQNEITKLLTKTQKNIIIKHLITLYVDICCKINTSSAMPFLLN